MFAIPLYTFLFIYGVFFVVFLIFSIINFYHIVATASFTFASFLASFFVFAATILTLYMTWSLLEGTLWQTPVILFDAEWITGIFRTPSSF